MIEGVVIFVLLVGTAVAIWVRTVHNAKSPWAAAGSYVQDVSRASGVQTEVSVAVDPSNRRNVFAAANESLEPEIRVLTSTNSGRRWTTASGPAFDPNTCAWGDPAVAIGADGRQYVAFTEKAICAPGPDLTPYLVVASRRGAKGSWLVRRVTRPATKYGFDDKPAIAAAADGRVYVAWSRLLRSRYQSTVVSSSSDGGKTWSAPLQVDPALRQPQLVTLAAGGKDEVYIAGVDVRRGIWIGRSRDGGRHFVIRQAAPLPGNQAATCIVFGKFLLPQQAVRCLGPNPTVAVGKTRVFVIFGTSGSNQTQDVGVAVFDRSLRRRVWQGRVGLPETKKADQFWPSAAVDPVTGDLWACYYDTNGDSKREKAWFSCTVSRDGRHWATPVRPARASANVQVLWEDARIYGYGDSGGYGGYTGVAAGGGAAYPLWIDTRNVGARGEEVFGARLPLKSIHR